MCENSTPTLNIGSKKNTATERRATDSDWKLVENKTMTRVHQIKKKENGWLLPNEERRGGEIMCRRCQTTVLKPWPGFPLRPRWGFFGETVSKRLQPHTKRSSTMKERTEQRPQQILTIANSNYLRRCYRPVFATPIRVLRQSSTSAEM